jgi:WD40 repeat protein
LAAGGLDSSVYLCDRHNANHVRRLYTGEFSVRSLAFAADGKRLAAGYRYEEVCLLDLHGRLLVQSPSRASMKSLQYVTETGSWRFPNHVDHSDGRRERFIQEWSGDLTQVEKRFGLGRTFKTGVHFGDGSSIADIFVGGDEYEGDAVIFQASDGREIGRTPRSRDQLHCLDVSPHGERFALGYRNGLVECFAVERSLKGPLRWSERPQVFRAHNGNLLDVEFVDSNLLATAGPDGLICVWQVGVDPSFTGQHEQGQLLETALSPDGESLLCGYTDGIVLLDAKSGRTVRRLPVPKGGAPQAVWSPSGRQIAVWADSTAEPVQLYDKHGRSRGTTPSSSTISYVAISPDDKLLATARTHLRLIDLETRSRLWETPLPQEAPTGWRLAFSHDGRTLAYGGNEPTIVLMDVEKRQQILEMPAQEDVHSIAFSPDDSKLATGHGDSLVRIWDLGTGRLIKELAGHAGTVRYVAFAADGDRLLTDSVDGTARLWSVRHGRPFGLVPHPSRSVSAIDDGSSPVHISSSSNGSALAISAIDGDGRLEVALVNLEKGED